MRTIPPALQNKLATGATTLCRCWTLTRRDGEVLGFTDHDADIIFDGFLCRAETGLNASELTAQLGLAVGGAEIGGALAADSLNEADLAAGRFDAATVDLYLVDWSEPALRVHLARGALGEVRRAGSAFTAEVRGLAHRLDEEHGRLYTARCGADLGDQRCRVDLSQPAFRGSGAVIAVQSDTSFLASGLGSYVAGFFTGGRLLWSGGPNAGLAVEVKTHRAVSGDVRLELWQSMAEALAPGDAFVLTAGCDKRLPTCRERFANAANFRGFPHIPGNDFVLRYPSPGAPGQGGSSLGDGG